MRTHAFVLGCAAVAIAVAVACGAVEPVASTFDSRDGGGAPPCPPPPMTCELFPDANSIDDAGRFEGCTPVTCEDQGIECGAAGDGCGGLISDCGKCQEGLRCGGPGSPSKCVSPFIGVPCMPKTCEEQGIECGPASDGCGGLIANCGTCDGGTQCGGEGAYSKCVTPTSDAGCTPNTCQDAGVSCGGPIPNGCGGLRSCGACIGNLSCKNGACVTACSPRTCTEAGAECGYVADGCGAVIDCGVCSDGFTCGYASNHYKCGRGQSN